MKLACIVKIRRGKVCLCRFMVKINEYVIICRQAYMDRAQLNEPFKFSKFGCDLLDSLRGAEIRKPEHEDLTCDT
jgi:hypothetical protein